MKSSAALLTALTLGASISCDVPLKEQYTLSSKSSLPEGVAYDDASHTFFATAVNGGQITRLTPLGSELVFHQSDDPNVSFSGAHVDVDARRLWVCVVDVKTDPFPVSKIVAFDIESKQIVHAVDLPVPSFCNDLTTDDAGVVYATDSAQPNIYRVDPAGQGFEVFATDPQFAAPQQGLIGLNGLDIAPDGESLLVVRTITPALFRVALSDPTDIVQVALPPEFAMPGDPRFPGPDGIEFLGDDLYIAYDGGVQQIRFTADDYSSGSVETTTAVPTGLTSLTVAEGDMLYAIDSEVYRVLYTNQPPELPFRILHIDTGLFEDQ